MSNVKYAFVLTHKRAVVGAPVFTDLRRVGVITAVHGLDPNNLAHAQARGQPISMVPLLVDVRWGRGPVEADCLSTSLGDYDLYLEDQERLHQQRMARRASLPTPLPVKRA